MNSVTELPFNRLLALQASNDGGLLQLPSGSQYLNHLGTVHAGALLSLAEAGSGEYLLRALKGTAGIIPVVRRLEARFRKPAQGAVSAGASVAPGALDELQTALAAKGRALVEVKVELHDESGTHVLSAIVEWFMTRNS